MKNNKYIIGYFILQVLTFLISSIYSVYIGKIFETILLIYGLFYVVNLYKGKERNKVNIYLALLILSLFIYMIFKKDASNVLNLLNLAITPIFIYTYFSENKINKTKSLMLINILTVVVAALTLLFKDYFLYGVLVITYPLIYSDRYFNNKTVIFGILTTLFMTLTNSLLVLYPMIFYLVMILISDIKNKDFKKIISKLVIIAIPIGFMIYKNLFGVVSYDSEVFGQESLLIKTIKVIISCIPIVVMFISLIKKYIKNKFKTNYEMYLIILSFIGFIFLNYVLKLDYPVFVITIVSLLIVLFNKYGNTLNKRIDDKEVTILALHLGFGGIEKYISSLVKMLDKYDVEIISTYKLFPKPAFDYKDAKIKYLINHGPNRKVLNEVLDAVKPIKIVKEGFKAIVTLINKKAYNIESILDINSKYVITTRDFHNLYAGYYLDKNIIKIATEHNYHNDDDSYVNKVVNSVKKSNYFVLVSEELRDYYSKLVNKKVKCVYIPNVIDETTKKKPKEINHNIISIGRLSREKGQMDLVRLVEVLKKKYDDIHLFMIGDGPMKEELEGFIESKSLEKNITLTGFLTPKEIEKYSLKSSVYVTTSYTESFGLTVIEEQNYSLPVVAFDTANGVKYLLKNGSGILVKNRSIKDMASNIEKLFEDKKLYNKYSEASKENASKYELKKIKPLWNDLLK